MAKNDTWRLFDEISSTYDRVNRILSMGNDMKWRRAVARFLPPKKPLDLIDLATGTGDQIIALFQAGAKIKSAIGIDLSTKMIEVGREKLKHTPAFLQRGDAQKLDFPDDSFDACTFSFGIRNVASPMASLLEIHRVLRPKGRCLILEFTVPRGWMKGPYLFYLRSILPYIGGLFSGKKKAYRYLNDSIEEFLSQEGMMALMRKAHFSKVYAYPMHFGGVTLYVGEK